MTDRIKVDDLVGFAEVAELLNTRPQQLMKWTKCEDFPEPLVRLRATPVWRRSDIRQWELSRAKKKLRG